MQHYQSNTIQRINRTRTKIRKTADRPRLTVYRSNKFIYAQIIDDDKNVTVCGFSGKNLPKEEAKRTEMEKAGMVGEKIAELSLDKHIKKVVFDRRGYKYHGQVKALAEGARSKGLIF